MSMKRRARYAALAHFVVAHGRSYWCFDCSAATKPCRWIPVSKERARALLSDWPSGYRVRKNGKEIAQKDEV